MNQFVMRNVHNDVYPKITEIIKYNSIGISFFKFMLNHWLTPI